jgi:hypothetical protein
MSDGAALRQQRAGDDRHRNRSDRPVHFAFPVPAAHARTVMLAGNLT